MTGFAWMQKYSKDFEPIIRFGNEYARYFKVNASFNTDIPLSLSDYQVIEKIYVNEGLRLNMSALAEELGIAQSAFSKTVIRLEKLNLVEKFHTSENRKDVILCVSAVGKKVYSEYSRYVYEHIFKKILPLLDSIPSEHKESYNQVLKILSEFPPSVKEDEQQKRPRLIRVKTGKN